MRENTRRNATSGFRPQSQYRPMSVLNPENRRVTFLMRTSTSQPRASKDNKDNAAPPAPAQTEGEKGQNESAQALNNGGDIGSMDEIRQLSPNFVSSATPLLVRDSVPAGAAVVSLRNSENGERPVLEKGKGKEKELEESTEPSISPPPRLTTPSPPPISSPTHSTPMRATSPTPSASTSKQTAAPRPSRSVRMRTPKRLPEPPSAPPVYYVGRDHARPSSPEPRPSVETSLPRSSSIGSHRTYDSGMRSTSPTPLLPPVPPVPPVPIIPPAEPSASAPSSSPPSQVSWSKSPLRNSVLPSDQPVILPRPKNAPAPPRTPGSSQPASPTSTPGHLPSLSGSMSQSGETTMALHSRFLGSLRRGKGKSLAGTADVRPISTQSELSVYSNND